MDTVESTFPINGLDVSTGYGSQRPLTSPIATNVRSRDPIKQRYRGGSRTGLVKYPINPAASAIGVVEQIIIAGEGFWIAPAGLTSTVTIEGWGGGGCPDPGMGGKGGNGGGGGEYARIDFFVATPTTKYAYNIGEGALTPVPAGQTRFRENTLIANGGLSDGSGGSGGIGDFVATGGNGGTSNTGLGGGGGGSSGYFFGVGNNGQDGQPSNIGGSGGSGFALSTSTPQGPGGNGATGDVGAEVEATAGSQPGGGGGGGCADTGGVDAKYLASKPGADGAIRFFYQARPNVQHLAQLVLLDDNYLISSMEDYRTTGGTWITDPSTNPPTGDPNDERNPPPGRDVPPAGSPPQPNRHQPPSARRRVLVTPNVTVQTNGNNALLNISLVTLPGSSGVGPGVITVRTQPPRSSGDGIVLTTNGAGIVVATVNEPSYEGKVTYYVQHTYIDTNTGRLRAVRGVAQIVWVPNYIMTAESLNGYYFLSGEDYVTPCEVSENAIGTIFGGRTVPFINGAFVGGTPIKLTATLKRADGKPIANRRIKTVTTFYSNDVENGVSIPPLFPPTAQTPKYFKTDSKGKIEFPLLPQGTDSQGSGYCPCQFTYTVTISVIIKRATGIETIGKTITIQTVNNTSGPAALTYCTPPPFPGVS